MTASTPPLPDAVVPQLRVRRSAWRDLLGGAVLLLVWLSLWTWLAVAVAPPLSGALHDAARAADAQRA